MVLQRRGGCLWEADDRLYAHRYQIHRHQHLVALDFFAFAAGLFLGSFANVAIYRIPRGLSLIRPRSFCTHCKRQISARDNIPLISFLLLGRRCRRCRAPISWREPTGEALAGFLAFLLWRQFGWSLELCFQAAAVLFLFIIAGIDLEHRIIPDSLSLTLLILGFVAGWIQHPSAQSLERSLLGALLGGGVLYGVAWLGERIFKQEAMGGGDIKLLSACGAWLGGQGALATLSLACLTGGIFAAALLLKLRKRRQYIPFGPFLVFGWYVLLFFPQAGDWIARWYSLR